MKKGTRCPSKLREQVVAWAVRRHEAGASWEQIQSELGHGFDTVRRWCVATMQTKARSLVAVEVVGERSGQDSFSVLSPSGFRVDGLTLSEAAALLREVG